MRVHVTAHRLVQTSPRTQLLVKRAAIVKPAARSDAGVGATLAIPDRIEHAGVAELADAQDLKSWVSKGACGFDSRPRH
jgi:hypothetical protein